MRFRMPVALMLVGLMASSASAGRIFGDIKLDGKPVPEGILVTIAPVVAADAKDKAKTAPPDSTKTDKVGSYKLLVKDEGKCTLTVLYQKQPLSLEVFSNKEATRYDLILEKKDGKLTLRRK